MKFYDSIQHVKGQSKFIDDLPVPDGTLFGYVFYSPVAHAKISKINFDDALKYKGFSAIICAKDIPVKIKSRNNTEEELFADLRFLHRRADCLNSCG
jgi:xanthine dehydrogenase molybdopterin-binding subunit B